MAIRVPFSSVVTAHLLIALAASLAGCASVQTAIKLHYDATGGRHPGLPPELGKLVVEVPPVTDTRPNKDGPLGGPPCCKATAERPPAEIFREALRAEVIRLGARVVEGPTAHARLIGVLRTFSIGIEGNEFGAGRWFAEAAIDVGLYANDPGTPIWRTTLKALERAPRTSVSPASDSAAQRLLNQVITESVRQLGNDRGLSAALVHLTGSSTEVQQAQASGGVAFSPPSGIKIIVSYPAEAARIQEEAVTVVGLVSAPKGISRLDLVVNGQPIPVSRGVRVEPGDIQNHPFAADVPLRPGQNVIALTATEIGGTATQSVRTVYREVSQPATTDASAEKTVTGERWAVVIGIDEYKDSSITPLRYATADAEAIFQFLTSKGGVKRSNARLLLNRDATQRNVRDVLGVYLRQKTLKDDEVIIYYAGHGTTEPDPSADGGVAKYLVPWDADPSSLFASAIPMEEIDRIFSRLGARKILLIQDTCFSGAAGGRTFLAKGLAARTRLNDRFLEELTQKEGRMILTASDVNQVSLEAPSLGHGIFTHYLLDGMRGAADLDGDGAVTVREMHLYLQRKVHEQSGGVQPPQLYSIGDMVLIRR